MCQIHHWKPKVDKNEPTVLIRKHFLSRIHWETNISIVTIISKYAKFKVYPTVCCDARQYNAGQYARGRLTPRFLTPYFKTLPVDSRNYITHTGQGFDYCLLQDYPHFYVTDIHWFLSIHRHNNRKFVARYRLTKLWGKTPTRMGVLPQAVVGVLPRGYIFFFLNMYTNSHSYQWNEIDKRLTRTILSNVKSLQIPVSVTKSEIITLQVWP